jgi:hypothetical protein
MIEITMPNERLKEYLVVWRWQCACVAGEKIGWVACVNDFAKLPTRDICLLSSIVTITREIRTGVGSEGGILGASLLFTITYYFDPLRT